MDFENPQHGLAWEFGFKIRAVETAGLLWSTQFGYRFSGLSEIQDQRFIFEAGVGAC
jgi:hypothetical protein